MISEDRSGDIVANLTLQNLAVTMMESFPLHLRHIGTGIKLGILPSRITLPTGMNLKAVIALLMGLVIQLSQAHVSWMTQDSPKSCGSSVHPMSCCEGLKSCPCVDEGDSNQKPAPLVPATIELKTLVSQVAGAVDPVALFSPPENAAVPAASFVEFRSGYAGVPLSVAFCSFVI
jgi:hypothetical protein